MQLYGLDWAGPGQRQVEDSYECGDEPSGSVKCGEFLDQLQTSQLLKKNSAPWNKEVANTVYHKLNKIYKRVFFYTSVVIICSDDVELL